MTIKRPATDDQSFEAKRVKLSESQLLGVEAVINWMKAEDGCSVWLKPEDLPVPIALPVKLTELVADNVTMVPTNPTMVPTNPTMAKSEAIIDSTGKRITDKIELKTMDIQGLKAPNWLSDNTISFCLNEILQKNPTIIDRVCVLNSFLFSRLEANNVFKYPQKFDQQIFDDIEKNVKGTMRMLRKTNIFEKELVVMPICSENHWMLVAIAHPARAISDGEEVAELYFLDSLENTVEDIEMRDQRMKLIIDYLLATHMEALKTANKLPSTTVYHCDKLLMVKPENLPTQMNSYDCGPFVIHFLEGILNQDHGIVARQCWDWNEVLEDGGITVDDVRIKVISMICSVGTEEANTEIRNVFLKMPRVL